MKLDKVEKTLDMLDKIYLTRQEELESESHQDREILKQKLNNIKIEEIEEIIKNNSNENSTTKEIINKIEMLIENYELQIDYYNEKNYKQGFKDAICLYTQCLDLL